MTSPGKKDAPEVTALRVGDLTKSAAVLDSWFIRASWPYKKDFLFTALNLLDKESLELLVLLLGPPTKEFYYSVCSFTNTINDIIPLDDNRQMVKETLDKYMKVDLDWLSSLPSMQTAYILIGLTELSGQSLKFKLYERAMNILGQLQVQVVTLPKAKMSYKKGMKDESELSKVEVNKSSKEYHTYKKRLEEYEEFIDKLKSKNPKNDQSGKKSKGTRKKSSTDSSEGIDFVQLLPSWINRKIFMYLDNETLVKCQRVNFYWKYAVSKLQLEKKVREKINQATMEMEVEESSTLTSENQSKEEKSVKSFKQDKKKKKSLQKTEVPEISSSEEFDEADLLENKNRLEMIDRFMASKDRLAFRKRHLLVWTLNEYTEGRAIAIGKNWIAMSRNSNIALCSLLTFAIMPGCLKGHKNDVISMAFHPDEGQMVSVAKDSVLRRWDIWSRQEMYNIGLPSPRLVAANKKYYVAAGSAIKAFCWEKNTCKWTMELDNELIPLSLSISEDDIIYVSILPGFIKMLDAHTGCLIKAFTQSKLTCMHQYEKYLATGNDEGWVTIWNICLQKPMKLTRRNFSRLVKGIILHEGCVMACTDDGKLHLWDIAKNDVIRSTVINADTMPIISISLLNYEDHCKIIVNTEMGLKILQFQYDRKIKKKQGFKSPQTCCVITPGLEPCMSANTYTLKMRDQWKDRDTKFREDIMRRQCCHPNLRRGIDKMVTIKESVENMSRETGEFVYFPRYIKRMTENVQETTQQNVQETEKNKFSRKVQPISYRNFLPIHNPYKQQF